jgi:tetratricopeptide (TPR) repeat protein
MYLRPKTTRRLLILGAVLVVIGGLAGTMWAINARRSAERIARARESAMDAFRRDDHAAALPHFSTYLTESKTADKGPAEADVEALLAYGKSRRAVPLKNEQHIVEAIKVFERYRDLRPDDPEARHLLLELYPQVKYDEEALRLANRVLADDPADTRALRAKVMALGHQREWDQALAVAERLVAALPNDLEAHHLVQDLMFSRQDPGDRIVARFEALLAAHPDDPRFELLLARAHTMANRGDEAVRLLRAAAGRKTGDPEVAAALTRLLEHYRLFKESSQVLEHLAQGDADALHVRPLVRRMWQGERYRDVLKRTEGLDPASPAADTELLAFRALALYDTNRPADAAAIVDALAARKDDVTAVAWVMALRARENENLAPRERMRQYEAALERAPANEVIRYFLGEAYESLGETEPAMREWRRAAQKVPSWAAPAAAISRTMAATGRTAEALSAAAVAHQRNPGSLSNTTGYVVAAFAEHQQNPDPEKRKRLLAVVTNIQAELPREPVTLHIYAALLSRSGERDRALSVIRSALDPKDPAPRNTLLQLSAVSFGEKLGVEREVLDFAARVYGLSVPIAVRQATLLAQDGNPKAGLKLLEEAAAKDTKSDASLWSVALLQYREGTGDAGVLADWVRLGDANPDNARVQQAILQSPSRTGDRAFWLRTIERLKRLTAPDAVNPRVERARWLLAGETTEKEASEAIALLRPVADAVTSLPEMSRLLGLALEKNAAHKTGAQRTRLLETAAAELNKAFEARHADAAVATDLTRVYRALGRNADADQVMSRVAERAADLGVDGRKRTARTLIGQGQMRKAIEVLEPIGDGQDLGRDAMLCSLYRRTGERDKAAALYRKMFEDQRVEPALLAEGADFFAGIGQAEEADRFLAKLRGSDVSPARREVLLAQYAERHAPPEAAVAGYEAAVAADPAHVPAWRGLIAFHLRRREFDAAAAVADRALRAVPDDADLRALHSRATALKSFRDDPDVEALADELAKDPQNQAIGELIRVLGEARDGSEPPPLTLIKLRDLADRNPDMLRLQSFVAQGHAKLHQYDEAERVAQRAAARAPNDPDAARLLTAIYAARPGAGKWTQVLEAARQWRQRSLDDPMHADVTIARALLELGNAAEAARQLEGYVDAPVKPDANWNLVSVYARALIRSGREQEAADLLKPLAEAQAAWRTTWLELGATSFDGAEDAARWVERVVPLLGDARQERVVLAETWMAIGARFSSDTALAQAKSVIEPMTSGPQVDPEGWRLLAMLSDVTGNPGESARAYRKLLGAQPDNADVLNNLAYALLEVGRGEDLPEARALAERAVARAPMNSTYLDTLARIQRQSGDLGAAEQTFRRALEVEPSAMAAMIGLADVQVRAGHRDKARELLVRINDAVQVGKVPLSTSLQQELEGVRQSVSRSVQSGRVE